jgi:hypothetical protein
MLYNPPLVPPLEFIAATALLVSTMASLTRSQIPFSQSTLSHAGLAITLM